MQRLRTALAVDLRAVALMRIAYALLILVDLAIRWGDIPAHYSDAGIMPLSKVSAPVNWLFGLYTLGGEVWHAQLLFGLTAAFAVMFALGYRARVANVALVVLVGALHTRNWLVLQGGDRLLYNMLFWLMFIPSGARWSLDARRRARSGEEKPPTTMFGAASFALYLQLFLLYFVTGTIKANYAHWWRGEGVYYALTADHFVTAFGRWLHPHWYVLKILTWLTLALELVGPLFVLVAPGRTRVRLAVVGVFVSFHLGIASTLHLGLFSFVCIATWLLALPTGAMDAVESAVRRRLQRDEAPASQRTVSPKTVGTRRIATVVVAFAAVYLVFATMVEDRVKRGSFRTVVIWPIRLANLHMRWAVFSGPREESGWVAAPARLANGRDVDLMRDGQPVSWELPPAVTDSYPNQRWRKMFTTYRKKHGKRLVQHYLRWLCQGWDGEDESSRPLLVRYVYVKHTIGARYDNGPPQREMIAQRVCKRPQPR